MVFLGAVVCAGASYVLHVQGGASYGATQGVTMDSLRNYYLSTVLGTVLEASDAEFVKSLYAND
jgi:hypothetical protein